MLDFSPLMRSLEILNCMGYNCMGAQKKLMTLNTKGDDVLINYKEQYSQYNQRINWASPSLGHKSQVTMVVSRIEN